MLILTRRPGESILIDNPETYATKCACGGAITVIVLAVKGNQVRIGIAAPANVTILREELVGRESNPGESEAC